MSIIKISDIIEDDGTFTKILEGLDDIKKSAIELSKLKKVEVGKINPEDTDSVKKYYKEIKELKKQLEDLKKTREKVVKVRKKASELSKKELIDLEKEREALRQRRAEAKAIIKVNQAQEGSIAKLRATLSLVTVAWGKLSDEERENTIRGKRLVDSKKQLTDQLKKLEEKTGDNRRSVGNYTEAIKKALRELKKEKEELKAVIPELKKQQNEVEKGSAEWIQYGKSIDKAEAKLSNINNELGQTKPTELSKGFDFANFEMPNFGDIGLSKIDGVAGGFTKVLGSINPVVAGIGVMVAGVTALGGYVLDLEKQFTSLRGEVQKTTGATGDELDNLTTNTLSLMAVFDADQQQLIRSQNVLMKTFGVTAEGSFSILEKGFLSGANAQGDLLDNINEYSAQIKVAGGDANDLIRILDKSEKAGIFNDKGVDTVKEFGLSIREQAKPTRDALVDAFGKDFAEKVLRGVSNGSLTTLQALEKVSGKMEDTTIPVEKLQTVMADVFKGAGEDAGIGFIISLQDITKETNSLIDATNPLVQAQKEQLELNKELAVVQQEIAKEFTGVGSVIENISLKFSIFFNEVLLGGINIVKEHVGAITGFVKGLTSLNLDVTTGSIKKFYTSLFTATDIQKALTFGIYDLTEAEKKSIAQMEAISSASENVVGAIKEQAQEYGNLLTAINDNNITDEERIQLVERLNDLNPEILQGLISEEGTITNLTEARRRLSAQLIKNAIDGEKARVKEEQLNNITKQTLKSIELQVKANKETTTDYLVGLIPFVETATEKLSKANNEIENSRNLIEAVNSKDFDLQVKANVEPIIDELTKGQLAQGFGDSIDIQKSKIDEVKKKIEPIKEKLKEIQNSDLSIDLKKKELDKLKKQLEPFKEELQGLNQTLVSEKGGYRDLLGLTSKIGAGEKEISKEIKERERSRKKANSERKKDLESFSKSEFDLSDKIRKAKNDVEENDLKKKIENLQIRTDKEKKGLEEIEAKTRELKDKGVISESQLIERLSRITELSLLAEKERANEIAKIREDYFNKQTTTVINNYGKETDNILIELELRLRKEGALEDKIDAEITKVKIERANGKVKELEKIEIDRINRIAELESKAKGSELTVKESTELKGLKEAKSLNNDILKLKLDIVKATSDNNEKIGKGNKELDKARATGKIEKLNREIQDQEELISKAGESATQIEIQALKDLIQQRYELRKAGVIKEFELQQALVTKGSDEWLAIEEKKNNAIEQMGYEHNKVMEGYDNDLSKAGKQNWENFTKEVKKVFNQVADKLEEVYKKSLQGNEDRLNKQNDLVDKQRERAENGLSNTLAFEQKEMAKREKELILAQKRLERVQKVKALYSSYTANASSSKDSVTALAKTLRDFAILEGITASFYTGGYTGNGGKYEEKGIVHGGEFVIDKETTSKLGLKGFSMDNFKEKFVNSNGFKDSKTILQTNYTEKQRKDFTTKVKPINFDTSSIENEIRELKEYEMSKPVQTIEVGKVVDGTLEFIETIITEGKEVTYRHKLDKDRF